MPSTLQMRRRAGPPSRLQCRSSTMRASRRCPGSGLVMPLGELQNICPVHRLVVSRDCATSDSNSPTSVVLTTCLGFLMAARRAPCPPVGPPPGWFSARCLPVPRVAPLVDVVAGRATILVPAVGTQRRRRIRRCHGHSGTCSGGQERSASHQSHSRSCWRWDPSFVPAERADRRPRLPTWRLERCALAWAGVGRILQVQPWTKY